MKVQYLRAKIAGLALFFLVCFGIFIYLYKDAGGRNPLANPYSIHVIVPDAFNLVKDGDVREAGIKIGVVDDITNPKAANGQPQDIADVKIDVDGKYAPIYKNAHSEIRTKTLVGENYLDLENGSPSAGAIPKGGTLPLSQAADAVQLDQILNALDPNTRKQIQGDLKVFGTGLAGHGTDLNNTFGALDPTVTNTGALMDTLVGQRQQVGALVDQFGRVMQAFSDRAAAVQQLSTAAKQTAVAVAARDSQLEAAFNDLPSFLDQTRQTTGNLGTFSGVATPVMQNLDRSMKYLAPAIQDLGPAARDTRSLTNLLPGFISAVNPVLGNLTSFSNATSPAITGLDATLRELNPFVTYLAPYNQEFGSFFGNVGSAVNLVDAVGHIARVVPVEGQQSIANLNAGELQLLNTLESYNSVQLLPSHEQANSYPKPGQVGNPQPYSGVYPHVNAAP
jgi:phospholipid/cholesterol/gamma-HCH transport system substrate-binding protein